MPYVMVPVPEEHVEAVMQFVLRAIARASVESWDSESVDGLWAELDEASRSLLSFVARAALAGLELDVTEAARKLEIKPREINAIVTELNSTARDNNRPSLLIQRTVTDRLPNGRVTDKRVIGMEGPLAEVIQEIEQAELLDAKRSRTGTGES